MEDGGKPAERKLCCISYRKPLVILFFFCTFFTLYCLNLTENSSTWTYQLWSHYLQTTSQIKQQNTTLKQLFYNLSMTTTKMAPTVAQTILLPLPSPPKYISPGPYLVEYPYKYNYIINEPTGCDELKPFLVLVVPVAPQNKEDRQIIRNTWGAKKVILGKNVALFFLLGLGKMGEKEILEESKQHKDIIQSDFVDCYKNLTIKTMVMLEWLDIYCHQAFYAMKIDSDMFLNLPKLMEMLQNTPNNNYLTGLVERAAHVHRYQSSKWFVPFEVFGENIYPPYVLGLGYVLSLDLPKKLVEASREVKALYIEDVYLGMCMRHLGLSPRDPPISRAFNVFPLQYNRCQYSRIIATTLESHTDRWQLWADFTKPEPHC
ncbi:beta-1,3-galactosyltransferase 5-like [Eucyclogobius newberryi]|uniref:beta-1,3-galactosyltransferase 5-like n=1 Tax=Eucyclogobius newberryi TaxID=166745 RepID=UPI003B5B42F6